MIEYQNPYDELTDEVIESIYKISIERNYPFVWTTMIICSLSEGRIPTAEDIQRTLDLNDTRIEELIDSIHKDLDQKGVSLPNSVDFNEAKVNEAAAKYGLLVNYCLN
ncbi:MAG: hypothetical protein JKX84_01320 [Flavobacteriales bacterium]|nr:hypothetical protein [Flavobacteriales bacterium]